jgi:NAD(P)-dependent dehydrogenase (short-subunit alcohol dehydrogenase family)
MDVRDKVCVVTGGASGIWLALCTRFAGEGAHVVLSDLDQAACEQHAASIDASRDCRACDPRRSIRNPVARVSSPSAHPLGQGDGAPDPRTPGRCSAQSSSQFVSPSALQMS